LAFPPHSSLKTFRKKRKEYRGKRKKKAGIQGVRDEIKEEGLL
jgi:hypothetical protein